VPDPNPPIVQVPLRVYLLVNPAQARVTEITVSATVPALEIVK